MSASDPGSRVRVAILGGGCGAMTAACYLTSTPALCKKYEVTVYQQGWRLGGKGATGRDQRPGYGDRIHEHGLHMWLGWYHNSFKLIQDVYAEWQKPSGCPYQSWSDAFEPQRFFTLQQDVPHGGGTRWVTRNINMPRLPGTPGQPGGVMELKDYFHGLATWLHHLYDDASVFTNQTIPTLETDVESDASIRPLISELLRNADAILGGDNPPAHPHLLMVRLAAAQLKRGEAIATADESAALRGIARKFLKKFQAWLHSPVVRALAAASDKARWYWQMLDFVTAVGIGMVEDVLPLGSAGIQAINGENFCDWIGRHGADRATQWCSFTRAIYNLAFSFDGGIADHQHARYEAGSALMVYLRMSLGYKNAPMWRMLAGMGDTIFSPIYDVLLARGVKFEFFHKVTALHLAKDEKQIASVDMDVQATIIGGVPYAPLYSPNYGNGKTFPCWPESPLWNQIENAAGLQAELAKTGLTFESAWCDVKAGTRTLLQGKHFDQIVLGISVAGVKQISAELGASSAAWRRMVDNLRTVETQAVQLWMQPTLEQLGWKGGATVMTTYQESLDTWGEMSDVLPMENWQCDVKPQSLHYFCGPMPGPSEPPLNDPDYPAATNAQVKAGALHWLQNYIGHLWPDAVARGTQGLDFSKLHDPANRSGPDRFDSQYWRANIDPSERYVASFPGTSVHRLWSDDSGFSNLFLAGDWTVSSVNGGCVEAAVESGMAASRGICGVPADIPNYPQRKRS